MVVMQRGRVVESGTVADLFEAPKDEYTRKLLGAMVRLDVRAPTYPGVAPFAKAREPLLRVAELTRHYGGTRAFGRSVGTVFAVGEVSFDIYPGETLGLVGESGCGKSTTGRLIAGLDKPTRGTISFAGADLASLTASEWRAKRREIQIVFQNPLAALDPRMTIGRQIREPLDLHGIGAPAGRDQQVRELMDAVSLAPALADRYPHQISGGQAQRAVIARALALEPRLIVCDEPVSALDVSVQARVTALLLELQEKRGLTYLFISHDLRVVKKLSHRVAVMYLGEIVETGATDELYRAPLHPYTMALISAIPTLRPGDRGDRVRLQGDPPSPTDLPAGCRFQSRCAFARERCTMEHPELRTVVGGRSVRCHFAEEIAAGFTERPALATMEQRFQLAAVSGVAALAVGERS
jgi:oligopeptide/dipeptide ABC transporter ATP-binding protein